MSTVSAPLNLESALKSLFSEVNLLATRLRFAPAFSDSEAGLAAGAFSVLRVLAERGPLTVPQIGRLKGTSRQNIQILVNRLVEDGCLNFAENPAHKRSELVHLTAHGKALFEKAVAKETGFMTTLSSDVSEARVAAADSLLREFRNRLEKLENSRNEPSQQSRARSRRVRRNRSSTPTAAISTRREPLPIESHPGESETHAEGDLPYNLL